jgi:hypothetical protein
MRRRFSNTERDHDIGEQQRSLINQVGVLENRRSDVAADLAEARAEWQQMQELSSHEDVDLPSFAKLYSNESALLATKRKVIDQEAVVVQLKARFQDNSPQVVQAQVALESFRAMLTREVESQIKLSRSRVDAGGATRRLRSRYRGAPCRSRDRTGQGGALTTMNRKPTAQSRL